MPSPKCATANAIFESDPRHVTNTDRRGLLLQDNAHATGQRVPIDSSAKSARHTLTKGVVACLELRRCFPSETLAIVFSYRKLYLEEQKTERSKQKRRRRRRPRTMTRPLQKNTKKILYALSSVTSVAGDANSLNETLHFWRSKFRLRRRELDGD